MTCPVCFSDMDFDFDTREWICPFCDYSEFDYSDDPRSPSYTPTSPH